MVIKKFRNGDNRVDWVKSLAILAIFGGFVIYAVTQANRAVTGSELALEKTVNIEKRLDRMENKIDKILERK